MCSWITICQLVSVMSAYHFQTRPSCTLTLPGTSANANASASSSSRPSNPDGAISLSCVHVCLHMRRCVPCWVHVRVAFLCTCVQLNLKPAWALRSELKSDSELDCASNAAGTFGAEPFRQAPVCANRHSSVIFLHRHCKAGLLKLTMPWCSR